MVWKGNLHYNNILIQVSLGGSLCQWIQHVYPLSSPFNIIDYWASASFVRGYLLSLYLTLQLVALTFIIGVNGITSFNT